MLVVSFKLATDTCILIQEPTVYVRFLRIPVHLCIYESYRHTLTTPRDKRETMPSNGRDAESVCRTVELVGTESVCCFVTSHQMLRISVLHHRCSIKRFTGTSGATRQSKNTGTPGAGFELPCGNDFILHSLTFLFTSFSTNRAL